MRIISYDSWQKMKRWMVVQKFTLARGYSWLNVLLIGFIAASQMKLLFPAFFDGVFKFFALVMCSTFGLWFVGWLDKRMRLLHVENAYGTETNPMMMEILDNAREKKDEQKL
jgi:hypothetical protein